MKKKLNEMINQQQFEMKVAYISRLFFVLIQIKASTIYVKEME